MQEPFPRCCCCCVAVVAVVAVAGDSFVDDKVVCLCWLVVEVEVETEHNCTGVMVGDLGGSR